MTIKKRSCLIAATAIIGISAVAFAEDVVIKLPTAKLRTKGGSGYPVVAELKKGDKVQLLAHEGTYVKVKFQGKEGYLGENTVASTAGGNPFAGLGAAASEFTTGSKGAGVSAAGKGDLRALELAASKGMSTAGLTKMLSLNEQLPPGDWEAFMNQGHVGAGKK
jgi:hypothetical protein